MSTVKLSIEVATRIARALRMAGNDHAWCERVLAGLAEPEVISAAMITVCAEEREEELRADIADYRARVRNLVGTLEEIRRLLGHKDTLDTVNRVVIDALMAERYCEAESQG